MKYHSFFLLLKSPSKPEQMIVESIYTFGESSERQLEYLWQVWQKLLLENPGKHITFRVFEPVVDNPFFPTTGFWTSSTNGADVLPFLQNRCQHILHSKVWRMKSLKVDPDYLSEVYCHYSYHFENRSFHWSELRTHITLGNHWGEALIIPDLFSKIEEYGRLPQMINAFDIKEVRVIFKLWRQPFLEQSIECLLHFLSQAGYHCFDIGSLEENHSQVSNSLALRGGINIGEVHEFNIDVIE